MTKPDRPAGRGRRLQMSPVKHRALSLGLPVLEPTSLKPPEAAEALRAFELDALVVVAYGLILPPAVLGVPRLGCFNIHASLLPRWRGAAPIQRALLAGDPVTGITIMRMQEMLDAGPVLEVRAIDIGAHDTAGTLQERLAALGAELICHVLDALAAGRAVERPQPTAGVTYAAKISKDEALIDWRESAVAVLRRIRAFNPFPVAETRLGGAQVRIWEAERVCASHAAPAPAGSSALAAGSSALAAGSSALATAGAPPPGSVLATSPGGIDVACGEGVVRVTRLQLAGRKPLTAAEFLHAQPLAGARFASV